VDLNEQLRRQLRVEYFRPVLDVISTALADRFNDDCIRILRNSQLCSPSLWMRKALSHRRISSLWSWWWTLLLRSEGDDDRWEQRA